MELVFQNPGLSHIGKKIVKSLNFKSLTSLRLVCKSTNNQVEDFASRITLNELQGLLETFTIARGMDISEKELWNRFLNCVLDNWPRSNCFMNLYLKEILSRDIQYRYKRFLEKSPILEFVLYGNAGMVECILKHKLHPIDDYSILFLLDEAKFFRRNDICVILEKFYETIPPPPISPR